MLDIVELRISRYSISRPSISPNPPPIDENPNGNKYGDSNDGNNSNEDVVVLKNSNNNLLGDVDADRSTLRIINDAKNKEIVLSIGLGAKGDIGGCYLCASSLVCFC